MDRWYVKWLKDRGISRKEFAAKVGISPNHLGSLLNGKVPLNGVMAARIRCAVRRYVRLTNKDVYAFCQKVDALVRRTT